jgi:hypothetical protein
MRTGLQRCHRAAFIETASVQDSATFANTDQNILERIHAHNPCSHLCTWFVHGTHRSTELREQPRLAHLGAWLWCKQQQQSPSWSPSNLSGKGVTLLGYWHCSTVFYCHCPGIDSHSLSHFSFATTEMKADPACWLCHILQRRCRAFKRKHLDRNTASSVCSCTGSV